MSQIPIQERTSFVNGRFQVIEILGEGGMAFVFRVLDTTLEVERALKVLKPGFLESPKVVRRFRAEAQIVSQLNHSGVVRVFDYLEDGQDFLIVMELVDGCSLDKRLEQGRLSPRQAVDVCLAVLSALVLAHEKGIVHRDIKPANILLTREGEVKVTDFGIARFVPVDALTRTGTTMGTIGFMAPEQKNAKSVDNRADLYSVAVLLFACLLADSPCLLGAVDVDRGVLDNLPAPLIPVVQKAAGRNRETRYASAQEMIIALTEARKLLSSLPENTQSLFLPPSETNGDGDSGCDSEEASRHQTSESNRLVRTVAPSPAVVVIGSERIREVPLTDPPSHNILWHRVIIAVILLIGLLVGLVWGIWWLIRPDQEVETIPTATETTLFEVVETESVPEPATVPKTEAEVASQPVVEKTQVEVPTKPVQAEPVPIEKSQTSTATPVLQHRVLKTWPAGQSFTPEVRITRGEYQVKVYVRLSGEATFKSFDLKKKNEVWRATVPLGTATAFSYFIRATSDDPSLPELKSGNGFASHSVQIK